MKEIRYHIQPLNGADSDFPYPKNLALDVRNFIVLTTDRVPPDDRETFHRFLEVISALERLFDMFE